MNGTNPIDTSADMLDSRDIQARIEWLLDTETADTDVEELAERKMLEEFRDECGSSEWPHGLTLIAEHYFTEYAQELANGLGVNPDEKAWPAYCIDWEYAARELKYDYSAAELDGTTYYFRD
jgi:antirestriction protein